MKYSVFKEFQTKKINITCFSYQLFRSLKKQPVIIIIHLALKNNNSIVLKTNNSIALITNNRLALKTNNHRCI